MAEENEVVQTGEESTVGTGDDLKVNETVDALAESLHLAEEKVDDKSLEPEPTTAAAEPETKPTPAAAAPGTEDRVPDTWRKEAQEKWATVDPVVKAEIAKREQDISRYVGEVQPMVNVAQGMSKILGPFMPVFEQYKVNPYDHINGLLHAHYNLLFGKPEQKVAMVQQICREVGINPAQLTDPNYKAAAPTEMEQRFLQELQRRDAVINELKGGVTSVTSALQEARVNELSAGIMAFAEDTENHPFFTELLESGELKALIDSGAARSLEEAYSIAVARNPTTRAKQLELDNAKAKAATEAANAAKVAAARKATKANVVSRTTGRPPPGEETVEQTIRSTLSKIREREGQ